MRGWFDAFRNDGGPTLYNFNNRTAVAGDITVITILTIFATVYIAFLIIFPGIRNEKFTTFFTVTLSLFVGATILVSLYGSSWHISNAAILSTYKAYSKEKIHAKLGIYVGLAHVNVTLQAISANNKSPDIDFNERFQWTDDNSDDDSVREATARGLPFPILTVAEYFSLGQEGLSWGSQYKSAGYFAIIMLCVIWCVSALFDPRRIPMKPRNYICTGGIHILQPAVNVLTERSVIWCVSALFDPRRIPMKPRNYICTGGIHILQPAVNVLTERRASFAIWLLMNLMLIVVPRYGVLLMTTCGFLLLATCTGYFGMLPEIPLEIRIEGKPMTFCFGWTYWLVVAAGGICLLSGVILTTMEIVLPHSFSTILEVDYDTPYDRHTIIEDSHEKRFQRKRNSGSKLENAANDNMGFRMSEQMSSKTAEKKEDLNLNSGRSEYFEMKSPESPWSYSRNSMPGRSTSEHRPMSRSISHDTLSTISDDIHVSPGTSRYRNQPEPPHEVTMW